jgi:hypothetical protein
MATIDDQQDAERATETNADRRRVRLLREIKKQHNWRIQTWAKAELYIAKRQAELVELGFGKEDLFRPDFDDQAMIEYYANHAYEE